MEGRPFVLLGVNGDHEVQTIQQVGLRDHLPWRNWWNGGSHGPLTEIYAVKSWPTTLVLDADGVVRYRGLYGEQLDRAVEALVRETEQRGRS
jgi:hypothetical protein